ncbi:LOW QUALITY PROTEIN: EF-hand calcium-binding domain-containing protein 6 [Aegotheles albertisi]
MPGRRYLRPGMEGSGAHLRSGRGRGREGSRPLWAEEQTILLQKAAEKDELKKAFQILDVGQTLTVTKAKFRRVTEPLLFHLTEAEFDAALAELCSAYQDIEKAFRAIDVNQSGFVSLDYLKSVINGFLFPLPNEIFQELMNRSGLKAMGKIAWQQFLEKFWDDLNGISSHISKEKQQREEKRQTELSKRIKQIEDQTNKYAQNRTVDEVIKRLKDRVIQQAATIKDSFFVYNKQSHGKINKAGLRKVLEDHSMSMDDSQFNLLTERLGLTDGGLSLDFVAILADYMTAEECLSQFNDKLMEAYGDTYSAFRETDSNHDGIINMLDFQQFLDSFLLCFRDEEFLRLLGLLGMNLTSTLNYQEFCQLFHAQETKEMITDAELACDHAHYYLVIKARTRWHDLARNFQEFDSEGNGIKQPRDLKKFLFRFGIPITPEEFKQLWARYDTDAKRYLTHQEFLQKLGIEFAPANTGPSGHITEDSYAHLQAHNNNQLKKHSNLEEQQKQQNEALHVEIKKQIKDKSRDYFQDFSMAFHKVDKNREGYVTVCDLHRLLQEFNYYLDHHQSSSLLNSLGISIHDSKLSCFDFLRAIDDGGASKYQQRQKQAAPPANSAAFSLEQTIIKMKEIVASSDLFLKNLWNTVDVSAGGWLEYQDFSKKFSSELVMMPSSTPSAARSATSTKPATHAVQEPRMSSKPEHPKTSSSLVVQKSIPASSRPQTTKTTCSAHSLNCETIENKIRKNIQHSWTGILKVCQEKDVSERGEISVSDFLDIAEKFSLDLSEGEINQITTKYDLKKNGRFAYYDFLQSCVLLLKARESSLLQRVLIQKPKELMSPGPQTTSFFSVMLRIQPQILRCWRSMKRTFRSYDEGHTGLLHIADFKQVLHEYSINLTEEELFNIFEYYDKNLSSKISYNDFLRAFIQ